MDTEPTRRHSLGGQDGTGSWLVGLLRNQLVVAFLGRRPPLGRRHLQDERDGADCVLQAFRKLNAVTVPAFVKVPKNEEEDNKMKAEREKTS